MTTYTHADLLAAIDKVQVAAKNMMLTTGWAYGAHLDTLAAILDLHRCSDYQTCWTCTASVGEPDDWPCPTVEVVADALRKMGAL